MARRTGKQREEAIKILATNRSAPHQFHLFERFEAGISLTGPEVKSVRQGNIALREAYVKVKRGEAFLHNCHIRPYTQGNRFNPDPVRPRKLLLHRSEIHRLQRASDLRGMTIVPTRVYLKNGWIKVEIALAKAKKLHDKREAKRRRDLEREAARERDLH